MSDSRQYTVVGSEEDEQRVWQVETISEGRYRVTTPDGRTLEVDGFAPGEGHLHFLVDGRSVDVAHAEAGGGLEVQLGAERHVVEVLNERQRRMRAAGTGAAGADAPELVSPMAGQVVKIIAEPGLSVETGEAMVVVEAMKMENDLEAHRSGRVDTVEVEVGQAVEVGDVLVTIADEDEQQDG